MTQVSTVPRIGYRWVFNPSGIAAIHQLEPIPETPFAVYHGDVLPGYLKVAKWGPRENGRNTDKDEVKYTDEQRELERKLVEWYSIEHALERKLNNGRKRPGLSKPSLPHGSITPRNYQELALSAIRDARSAGSPGFLLADPTGSGKMVVGATFGRDLQEAKSILVIGPLNSITDWCKTIGQLIGDGNKNWVVTHYEAMWKLFDLDDDLAPSMSYDKPAAAINEGTVRDRFDLIIVDEAHKVSNLDTYRSRALMKLVEQSGNPFVLHTSATPVTVTDDSFYLAPLLGWKIGIKESDELLVGKMNYEEWFGRIAERCGFEITYRSDGKMRVLQTEVNDRLMHELVFQPSGSKPPVGISRSPDQMYLPVQQRSLTPITLTRVQRDRYEQAWADFYHTVVNSNLAAVNPNDFRTLALRTQQKSSLVRVPATAKKVAERVAEGYSVIVTAWFLETISQLQRALAKILGDEVGVLVATGDQPPENRLLHIRGFTDGMLLEHRRDGTEITRPAPVIITNVVDAINLHQGMNPHGNPRWTVATDVLVGGKRLLQGEGRGTRDGYHAPVEYVYAADTYEERLLARTLKKAAAGQRKLGNLEDAARLENLTEELDETIEIPGSAELSEKLRSSTDITEQITDVLMREVE